MALNDVPSRFDVTNEDNLRFAVSTYFLELGFTKDELLFESQFSIQLGHNSIIVSKQYTKKKSLKARSDLLLTRNGKVLAIVETKSPHHALTDEDAWQAISYGRLMKQVPPYAFVTNGHETKVYNVFAPELELVDNPTNLPSRKVASVSEDLRYEAARLLIGINVDTLKAFSEKQVENALSDFKGSFYIPDVYLDRPELAQEFESWLQTETSCFAIIGESGIGKTNFMCASTEKLLGNHLVLFYPVSRLVDSLTAGIKDDFVWEFQRDQLTIVQIFERLETIVHKHGKKLFLFLDGLDEFVGDKERLRNELLELATRLKEYRSIKLCVSCKSTNWDEFVIERSQFYNIFAKSVFSPHLSLKDVDTHDAKKIGIWVSNFSDTELDSAFLKYRDSYKLQGNLYKDTRNVCHYPFMLRLIAEVYHGQNIDIPSELTALELFELYWKRKFGAIKKNLRNLAEQMLIRITELVVRDSSPYLKVTSLFKEQIISASSNNIYQELLNIGLLNIVEDNKGNKLIGLSFNQLLNFIYVIKVKEWGTLDSVEIAKQIIDELESPRNLEFVSFYFTVVDQGKTPTLLHIALLNIRLFLSLMEYLGNSFPLANVSEPEKSSLFFNRLENFCLTYSALLKHYFPTITYLIPPYTGEDIGVWLSEDFNMMQLRSKTKTVPHTIVILPNDVLSEILRGNMSTQMREDLLPMGTVYIGSSSPIYDDLPQREACKQLTEEIKKLLENRFLNEQNTPICLEERIWHSLLNLPSVWFQGETDKPYKYFELLELDREIINSNISIELLKEKILKLNSKFGSKLPRNFFLNELRPDQRGSYLKAMDLRRLHYWLDLLSNLQNELHPLKIQPNSIFRSVMEHNSEVLISIIYELIPEVLKAYRSMVSSNFPALAHMFSMFQSSEHRLIVEVGFGNMTSLTYILLPSTTLPQKYYIRYASKEGSTHDPLLITRNFHDVSITYGGRFGYKPFKTKIDNVSIDESKAIFYSTHFWSNTPILDQVYQLLAVELEALLGTTGDHWSSAIAGSGSQGNEKLDSWITAYFQAKAKLKSE